MTTREDLVFDAWTSLSFKRVLGNKRDAQHDWMAPRWVGDHARRLTAYKILQGYQDNAARHFLTTQDEDRKDAFREYGDAALVVETIVSALMGETQHVITDGAAEFDATRDENAPDAVAAVEFQTWMRELMATERFPLKMIESERNSVGLGDGVYAWGWSPDKKRPRLRVYDPGFYFPVLDDGNEDDYPTKCHIAWELETDDHPAKKVIRRITYEIGYAVDVEGDAELRIYPWNTEPTFWTCYMTDATWTIPQGGPQTVEDLAGATADFEMFQDPDTGEWLPWDHIDIGLDFIPVVHVPNTISILNHYGKSSVATVLQVLDDIANADTDLNLASATTGTPPVSLSGTVIGETKPSYKPGEVWQLGENGKMDVMDTSRALDALLKYVEALLSRLSINSRLPESIMGRVKPSEVPSGIALALSFGPLVSMIAQMRLVRAEKYPLLMKFGHRIALAAQARGDITDVPVEWIPTSVQFGSFLPNDVKMVVDMVVALLTSDPPAISIETAVRMLTIAGVPIEDAVAEVARITGRDFAGAVDLAEATKDPVAVFEYLGREASDPELLKPEEKAPPEPDPAAPTTNT